MSVSRIFKLLISACVFGLDRSRNWWRQIRQEVPLKSPSVLLYHMVGDDQLARFGRQMKALVRLAQPVRADAIEVVKTHQCQVIVTFDDGYYCTIENILPVMMELQIPFTIFVPTRFLGKVPDWTNMNRKYRYGERLIDINEIKQLKDHELISFGSHSATHADFMQLNSEQICQEMAQSKQELEAILTKPVELFSFPYGNFAPHSLHLIKNSGFRRLFTTHFRMKNTDGDGFLLDRVQVEPTDWALEFKLKTLGCYRWLPIASRLKTHLVKYLAQSQNP